MSYLFLWGFHNSHFTHAFTPYPLILLNHHNNIMSRLQFMM
jgi:hypothetical protein